MVRSVVVMRHMHTGQVAVFINPIGERAVGGIEARVMFMKNVNLPGG